MGQVSSVRVQQQLSNPLWGEKPQNMGPIEETSPLAEPGVSPGMRRDEDRTGCSCPLAELALAPGDPHTPPASTAPFPCAPTAAGPRLDSPGWSRERKPAPPIPNPKGALLFSPLVCFLVVFVFNCSAPPLSPHCPLRLTKHFLLVVPSLGCICFGLS